MGTWGSTAHEKATGGGAVESDRGAAPTKAAAQTTWRGSRRLLQVRLETHADAAVLRLRGSAGITEAEGLAATIRSLLRQQVPLVVLDLSGLHYVASVAVSAIAAGLCRGKVSPEQIRLAAPSPGVLAVLTRSPVVESVRIYPSVAAAMACHQPASGTRGGDNSPVPAAPLTRRAKRVPVIREAVEVPVPVRVTRRRVSLLERMVARALSHGVPTGSLPQPA